MRASWPFFPPAAFDRYREATLCGVFETGTSAEQRFVLADAVAELERWTAAGAGVKHAVACANATGALALVLDAWDIGAGAEVIVPAYGCQPVVDTVVDRGATPVFADVDPRTFCIDPAAVAAVVTPRTAALVPAHVFATMADMPALAALARRLGLRILEDAAVAQGATLDGRAAGAGSCGRLVRSGTTAGWTRSWPASCWAGGRSWTATSSANGRSRRATTGCSGRSPSLGCSRCRRHPTPSGGAMCMQS